MRQSARHRTQREAARRAQVRVQLAQTRDAVVAEEAAGTQTLVARAELVGRLLQRVLALEVQRRRSRGQLARRVLDHRVGLAAGAQRHRPHSSPSPLLLLTLAATSSLNRELGHLRQVGIIYVLLHISHGCPLL